MGRKNKKALNNYIDPTRFVHALSANQDKTFDEWMEAMKQACRDSNGSISKDFQTSIRRKAGQVIRHINKELPEGSKWSMPRAPEKARVTYVDIARQAGLLNS